VQPGVAPAVAADVTLSADPATNSVIINASMQDYQTILRLLESLDIERPQVFVEAIIAEVTVDRSRELGFEFQVGGDLGDGTGLARTALSALNPALADPTALTGLIAAAVSDKTIELPDGTEVPAQVALFRALATDNDINVLSAPTLLTLDNQEARIVVGENVPFVTSQGVDLSSVDNVFTTIERRDVGIKLTITPQVSEGDVVILEVEEEISALVENALLDEDSVGPTTTIRVAETTVSVRDGRTAVIGGLIANSVQRRASKVPILGDIPVLGRLFRTDAAGDEKVNLIVILTPHIIRNADDLDRISEERKGGFHDGEPEAEVPFPPTGEPFVIPAEPEPSGPAYSPEEGERIDDAPSTSGRRFGPRPERS
jgi:general secretion pathway protein D